MGIVGQFEFRFAVTALSEPELHDQSNWHERLPIHKARSHLDRLAKAAPEVLLQHMIRQWIIVQHTYWSVGRGIIDARPVSFAAVERHLHPGHDRGSAAT